MANHKKKEEDEIVDSDVESDDEEEDDSMSAFTIILIIILVIIGIFFLIMLYRIATGVNLLDYVKEYVGVEVPNPFDSLTSTLGDSTANVTTSPTSEMILDTDVTSSEMVEGVSDINDSDTSLEPSVEASVDTPAAEATFGEAPVVEAPVVETSVGEAPVEAPVDVPAVANVPDVDVPPVADVTVAEPTVVTSPQPTV